MSENIDITPPLKSVSEMIEDTVFDMTLRSKKGKNHNSIKTKKTKTIKKPKQIQPVEKRRMIRKTFGRYDHKKICQYSPNGSNLLKTWKSANQIETEEGFDKNAILRSCKRIQIRAYHYLWRFEGDTDMEPKLAEFAYEDD
jgi:hypothetical protein